MKAILRQTGLIITLSASLFGQSLTLQRHYPADSGLRGVVASTDTNTITPFLFIYQKSIVESETGETLFRRNDEDQIIYSANRHMLALYVPAPQPAGKTEPRSFELWVFSAESQALFSLKDRYCNQSKTPLFFLNESKKAALEVSPNGDRLKVFDNHGRLLREKSFSQNRPHNYENSIIRFCGNGDRLAFYTRVFDMESNRWDPMLYLLSPIGEEIYKTRLVLKRIDDIAISQTGKSVAVAGTTLRPIGSQSDYHIFVFDSLGNMRNSLPYRAIQLSFDTSEKHLLIRDEQTVKIVDLINEGIQTSVNICSGRQEIADITFLNDCCFAVSSGTIKFKDSQKIVDNPTIRIYSVKGKLLAEKNFPDTYTYTAKIYKSISGQQIGFCVQNSFITLQLN